MPRCSPHVVKTSYPNGRVDWELHCFGDCPQGECAEVYVMDPEPHDTLTTTVKTCACPNEHNCLTCPPPGVPGGPRVTGCRVGLRFGYTPDARPTVPLGVVCVGECEGTKKCAPYVVGETTFDGITIQIYKCKCDGG